MRECAKAAVGILIKMTQIASLFAALLSKMAGAPPTGAFPAPTHASTAAAAGRPFEIDDEPSAPNVAMPDAPPPPVPGADPSTENNNGDALMGGVSVGGDGQNGGKALMGEGAVKVRV